MALNKSYLSVNGELYAEWTEEAKTEVGYIRDALGNVMETVNADGTTLNTYNYKPFGDVLSKTGVEPDPNYLWCGTWGYRASGNKWVSHYVRARHYSFADAAWTSVDPLWPSEMAYGYVDGRVMTGVDPSGLQSRNLIGPRQQKPWTSPPPFPEGANPCSKQWNRYIFHYCNWCYYQNSNKFDLRCQSNCDKIAKAYYLRCKDPFARPGRFRPKGEGDVVVPAPPPQTGPCITAHSCKAQGHPYFDNHCANYGLNRVWPSYLGSAPIGVPSNITQPVFNMAGCIQCCDIATGQNNSSMSPDCRFLRNKCYGKCRNTRQNSFLSHISNFAQENPKPYRWEPLDRPKYEEY